MSFPTPAIAARQPPGETLPPASAQKTREFALEIGYPQWFFRMMTEGPPIDDYFQGATTQAPRPALDAHHRRLPTGRRHPVGLSESMPTGTPVRGIAH